MSDQDTTRVRNNLECRDNEFMELVNRREMTRPSSSPLRTRNRQSVTWTCTLPFSPTLQADDRPIVDSTSVVSNCPNKFASEVRVVDPEQLLNMLIVLGGLLRHSGTRRGVKFRADGSEMRVNFEVTEKVHTMER